MIRRADIKPGAEFISAMGNSRTILGVGEHKALCRDIDGREFSVDIALMVSEWNYPPKPKIVGYINVYPHSVMHDTRSSADKYAGANRIACVRVEFEEGQFDE